ncbi:hypothetical protein AGABI2DRAFT_122265 [Agaricus bisporus var. bisporus H97]|uniref:hypothetical protein n=1 Tax=Agaricus bisporus var. bisporus (strain H97 / ATCC MYA-4626 / FGSC 10389) TaxID=936046 RepID=UPI00029F7A52|nr:hypothetical protein AGABI2DRAFT_122265 [Agaricus bisporus var. bisporus H97]EKV42675.1 hypothetical protein AGABI2DRAFT_122265 [Agaricus bisporus var. bisporus H97]
MEANPSLQGSLLLVTQIELVSGTTAAGTLYGIAFSLYCLYLHASIPQLRDHNRKRQTRFMITYSTIIMLCGLYYLLSNAWVIQDAYIMHANFPGGPYLYENPTQPPQFRCLLIYASFVIQADLDSLFSDLAFMGRLGWPQVVDQGHFADFQTQFFATLALRIRAVALNIRQTGPDSPSPGVKPEIAELALQAIITILPTTLIAGFLIFESQRQRKLIGKSQQLSTPYMGVVAMLIESYAVESIWAIIFVILFARRHPMLQFFGNTQPYIEIIAYLLVLYRVANGRAYGSQRARESQSRRDHMSSLHWHHTAARSDVTSGSDTDVHTSGIQPEVDMVSQKQDSSAPV